MPHGILVLSAAIAGIALDGVDNAVFAFLHNADMIGLAILRAGTAFVIPIEEDDLTGGRFKAAVLPLPTVFEPLDTVDTACEFRDNTAVDITALIGTPRTQSRRTIPHGSQSRTTTNRADRPHCRPATRPQ